MVCWTTLSKSHTEKKTSMNVIIIALLVFFFLQLFMPKKMVIPFVLVSLTGVMGLVFGLVFFGESGIVYGFVVGVLLGVGGVWDVVRK